MIGPLGLRFYQDRSETPKLYLATLRDQQVHEIGPEQLHSLIVL